MKVLVINGSPKGRKSNTWKLTEQFLEGMRESVKGRTEARLTKAQTGEKEIPETAERDAGEASRSEEHTSELQSPS